MVQDSDTMNLQWYEAAMQCKSYACHHPGVHPPEAVPNSPLPPVRESFRSLDSRHLPPRASWIIKARRIFSWAPQRRSKLSANMADLPAGVSEVEVEVETLTEPQHEVQIETQPMIALQPLADPEREEIVVQTTEEVIEESKHPVVEEVSIATTPSTKQRKGRGSRTKGLGRSGKGTANSASTSASIASNSDRGGGSGENERSGTRKWEQKQVQIKTLEGEFAVTMWASGTFSKDGRPSLSY